MWHAIDQSDPPDLLVFDILYVFTIHSSSPTLIMLCSYLTNNNVVNCRVSLSVVCLPSQKTAMQAPAGSEFLRVGDHISLFCEETEGYVYNWQSGWALTLKTNKMPLCYYSSYTNVSLCLSYEHRLLLVCSTHHSETTVLLHDLLCFHAQISSTINIAASLFFQLSFSALNLCN